MRPKYHGVLTIILILVINGLVGVPVQSEEVEVPPPRNYISDHAKIIDQATEEKLHDTIAELEEKKGSRIMVLTIKSAKPLKISTYSSKVINNWDLGTKDVLLLIALEDGDVYLDAGKGLKKILSDKKLEEILNNSILPSFNQGNFSKGTYQGVTTMASVISNSLPDKQAVSQSWILIGISLAGILILAGVLLL